MEAAMIFRHELITLVQVPRASALQTAKNIITFGKSDRPLSRVLQALGEIFYTLKIENALWLKIDGRSYFPALFHMDNTMKSVLELYAMATRGLYKPKKVNFLAYNSIPNVTITYSVTLEAHSGDRCKLQIIMEGALQIPKTVSTATFGEDLKKELDANYAPLAEVSFIEARTALVSALCHTIAPYHVITDGIGIMSSVRLIVPNPNGACAPWCERNFTDSESSRTFPPQLYYRAITEPNYIRRDGLDPYEFLFWYLLIRKHWERAGLTAEDCEYIDILGNKLTRTDARVLLSGFKTSEKPLCRQALKLNDEEATEEQVVDPEEKTEEQPA